MRINPENGKSPINRTGNFQPSSSKIAQTTWEHSHAGHSHAGHSHGGHSHGGHSHDHSVPDHLTRSFVLGIILNIIMVLVGAGIGIWTHSLALLSDAGHNLSDVASLLLALWGLKLSKVKSNNHYTYGYKKVTILTSLINAIVLIGVTVWILIEAAIRLKAGSIAVPGLLVSSVAFLGIIINSWSAYLFIGQKDKDLNVKGAYMHMAADALVSFGVVLAGILIYFSHWYWLDPLISIIISGLVLWGTWGLLAQSFRLSMDGVPDNLDMQSILVELGKISGIRDTHHVHVWALSTNEYAFTAHLVLDPDIVLNQADRIKAEARHVLQHFDISHATLEIESSDEDCKHEDC
jgi:cobalt-zinc-cadmium efflux system protein